MPRFFRDEGQDRIRLIWGDWDLTGYVDGLTVDSDDTHTFRIIGVGPHKPTVAVSDAARQATEMITNTCNTETPGGDMDTRAMLESELERLDRSYEQRAERIRTRLAELDRFGDDPFADGDVIVFNLMFIQDKGTTWERRSKPYHYAAVRYNGLWSTTGPKSPKEQTWYALMKWIDDNDTVDGIWFVDTLRPIDEK